MEKIKRALELARQQQADNISGNGKPAIRPRHTQESVSEDTESIRYSSTRVLRPDPDTLIRNRILVDDANKEVATAYRMLRTQVLQKLVANDWNSIALTSPGPSQGKTTTAINLALSLAREVNYTVLLIDFDLKKPGIHRQFGIEPEYGISDVLLHDVPLQQALINPGIERLVLLPGRESISHSSEMLKSKKMRQLVEELKSRYETRLLIFDLPPLLATDDALAFSPYVQSFLLVLEEGQTGQDEIQQSLELLKETNIMGTVLNKSSDVQKTTY